MRILGIIAEYNPFHNGHLHHLEKAKKLTQSNYTIAIMSPNFVQRGSPAIVNKWARTKMALLAGVDLVIELPTPYATASAEFFASASIALLDHTGIVDSINFGSESNHMGLLDEIASIFAFEPKQFKQTLKKYLDQGITFPKAREKALIDYAHTKPKISHLTKEIQAIIGEPNNILGLEYLKALKRSNSSIRASILQRKGPAYHQDQMTGEISSATAIRKNIHQKHWENIITTMPCYSYDLLYHHLQVLQDHVRVQDLSPYLCYRLLFSSTKDLKEISGVTEGMENRILNQFGPGQTIDKIIPAIKSKRFTQTAIQRMVLNIILQLKKEDFESFQNHGGPQYIRVLGFKKSSSFLLKKLKQEATLPLILNPKKDYNNLPPLGKKMFDIEMRTTNLYTSLQTSQHNYNEDFTHPLVILPSF